MTMRALTDSELLANVTKALLASRSPEKPDRAAGGKQWTVGRRDTSSIMSSNDCFLLGEKSHFATNRAIITRWKTPRRTNDVNYSRNH